MKQLVLTDELKALLKAALGPDVDVTDDYAVFEVVAINNTPLPGKRGTIFEGAVVTPLTLREMVEDINGGNTLPLMIDHNLEGAPKGRVFHAGLNYDSLTGDVELRQLFYVDPTEEELIAKINNGTYDEVSVGFLAEKILCSECGWDYRGEDASFMHLFDRTCENGHTVGEDGVHVRLTGLEQFTETSMVARGAAKNPKILGRSASKLAPATAQRLAARGFEADALICQASLGEEIVNVDVNKLIADFSDAKGEIITLKAAVNGHEAALSAATTARDEALGQVTELSAQVETLTTELSAAKEASRADEADAAITYLSTVLKKVRVAAQKEEGEIPATVAELTAAIDAETSQLTAILPVGGVGNPANTQKEEAARDFSAFKINR